MPDDFRQKYGIGRVGILTRIATVLPLSMFFSLAPTLTTGIKPRIPSTLWVP